MGGRGRGEGTEGQHWGRGVVRGLVVFGGLVRGVMVESWFGWGNSLA